MQFLMQRQKKVIKNEEKKARSTYFTLMEKR